MRSKQIVALITFFACFGLSSFFVELLVDNTKDVNELYKIVTVRPQSNAATSRKILALLQQDNENGLNRYEKWYSFRFQDAFSLLAAESALTSEYVENSGSIDDSGLPRDFQIAWRKHMKAWANYSDFLEKAEKAEVSIDAVDSLKSQYNNDIDTTFAEVLRVAASHDAEFSE